MWLLRGREVLFCFFTRQLSLLKPPITCIAVLIICLSVHSFWHTNILVQGTHPAGVSFVRLNFRNGNQLPFLSCKLSGYDLSVCFLLLCFTVSIYTWNRRACHCSDPSKTFCKFNYSCETAIQHWAFIVYYIKVMHCVPFFSQLF